MFVSSQSADLVLRRFNSMKASELDKKFDVGENILADLDGSFS
jgi:hypothetical protein